MLNCQRYEKGYIVNYNKLEEEEIKLDVEIEAVKAPRTAADYVAERKAKREKSKQKHKAAAAAILEAKEQAQLGATKAPTEPVPVSTPEKKRIVFKEDGYDHEYCPVSDTLDRELRGIMDDTLYCISTNTMPNDGNAMDQSALFRLSFSTLKTERDILKNEMEKKAIDKSKKEAESKRGASKKSPRGRGRH